MHNRKQEKNKAAIDDQKSRTKAQQRDAVIANAE
jgi:hypothetical protein